MRQTGRPQHRCGGNHHRRFFFTSVPELGGLRPGSGAVEGRGDQQPFCNLSSIAVRTATLGVDQAIPQRPAAPKPERHQLFISYSHRDGVWVERLRTMIKPLEQRYGLERWDDSRIQAGARGDRLTANLHNLLEGLLEARYTRQKLTILETLAARLDLLRIIISAEAGS